MNGLSHLSNLRGTSAQELGLNEAGAAACWNWQLPGKRIRKLDEPGARREKELAKRLFPQGAGKLLIMSDTFMLRSGILATLKWGR